MLKLYGFSKVDALARGHTRDLRVRWAPEEMQLPLELPGMDHPAHELSSAADRRLSRDFVATAEFTVADILMAHVLAGIQDATLIAPYPRVVSCRDRRLARPAWQRTIDAYCARVEAG